MSETETTRPKPFVHRCAGCTAPLGPGRHVCISGIGTFHRECAPPQWPIIAAKPYVSTANG